MEEIRIDFTKGSGIVKPMHAVNNGPMGSARSGRSTFSYFKEAGIPYIRNHDSAFCTSYGGEYTVDVHRIFPDFDADEKESASYDFQVTDQYVKNCFDAGGEVFYRLGATIEHGKKRGTFPPKDFHKWAVICEHIIRHYTEGWADGFHYPIRYWEIWNEPDCQNADGTNPCWQGSWEEFEDFFITAFKHLKGCFPHLKIGGPAHVSLAEKRYAYIVPFLERLKSEGISLDFFSFHRYCKEPQAIREYAERAQKLTREAGFDKTELILNEWNYVRGWTGADFDYSVHAIKGLKGASLVAGCMCVGQDSGLDMLMYYDARPCVWNGMFHTDFLTPLKGYYPFRMFGSLYRLGEYVKPDYKENPLYCAAAKGEDGFAFMLTHYREEDTAPAKTITLSLSGLRGKEKIEYFLLDEKEDMPLVKTQKISGDNMTLTLEVPLYTTWFLSVT